jgi:hypothetical protein
LSRIMRTSLLLGTGLLVCSCWWLISTDFGTCSYQWSLSNLIPISLCMLKCRWAQTLSCIIIIIIIIIIAAAIKMLLKVRSAKSTYGIYTVNSKLIK